MRRLRILLLRLRSLVRPRRVDQELDDELRYHLDRQIETLTARGETPENARRLALQDMGGLEQRREECRDTRGVGLLTTTHATLRDAWRSIKRRPASGLVTIATLALGIGGGATMVALVDLLMLRPPAAIHEPDRVVTVPISRNYVVFGKLREATQTLDLAAYTRPRPLSLGVGSDATPIRLECVTPSYFRVLGTPIAMGRTFSDDETIADTNLVIILAHHFWQQRFRSDANAIGQTVQIARRTYNVIGIAPRDFRGIEAEPVDGWIVLEASPASCSFDGSNLLYSSGDSWMRSIARLRQGITRDQAITEVELLRPAIDDRWRPEESSAPRSAVTLPTVAESTATRMAGDRRIALWLLGGGIALLLIACANVAGVLAIRAIDRQREFAIRAQLGASRARVASQVMAESVALGALGGVAAWALAWGLDRALRSFFSFLPDAGLLDSRFFFGLAIATALAGVASGIAPSIQAARTSIKGVTGLGATRRASRLRHALLVTQVALALVLATAAGLFARSVSNARTGLGYDTDRVIVAAVDFERAGYRRQAQIQDFFDRLVVRARETPGVERVALSVNAPFELSSGSIVAALVATPNDPSPQFYPMTPVSPGYFVTMGTRILSGREFLDSDDAASTPVLIVSEGLARTLWPDGNAVGRCAYLPRNEMCMEVIGVSEQRRHSRIDRAPLEYFVSTAQPALTHGRATPRTLLIRTSETSDRNVAAIAAALRSAAPDMPFVNVQRLDDLVDSRARTWRLGSTLFSFFGTAAVGLAAIGIFAALSFVIRQRTREMGLRLALGATHAQITWLVARFALIVIVTGLALGGMAAFLTAPLIEAALFGVAPTDIGVYVWAALVIAAVGAAACVVPCLRARRIDPIVVLKTE